MTCTTHTHGPRCFIVPPDVMKRFARGHRGADGERTPLQRTMQSTWLVTQQLRSGRETARLAAIAQKTSQFHKEAAAPPPQSFLYDCGKRHSLPGRPIASPETSADIGVKTVYETTRKVAEFYTTVLGRNSIDNRGLDLVSSLHYRQYDDEDYDNAFWDGHQMVYGDGDGTVFTGFYGSPDVIGHELTHGVTQYESHLAYDGESGALNESFSDVVGAVFHQWLGGWTADKAEGWLIGAGIMGPLSIAQGQTCLRDMADPGAAHCLSPQPGTYDKLDPTADVHINSGIPNLAFVKYAQAVRGRAWEAPLSVWYRASTGGRLAQNATIKDFARGTLAAAATLHIDPAPLKAAWAAVNLDLAAG